MKNREERPTASDRGASQQTFDFGNEIEPTRPANLLRQELTDPAFIDTPSLSVSPDADLMEQVIDPRSGFSRSSGNAMSSASMLIFRSFSTESNTTSL